MKNISEITAGMNETVAKFLTVIVEGTQKTGARFASFNYTASESNETSRYNVLMGVKMETLYKKDLEYLTVLRPTLSGIKLVACDELIASINESLTKGIGNNSAYTLKGYYEPLDNKGEVKLHTDETGARFLYIRGYVIKRTVITPGVHKVVKSSEKTLAKKEIEKNLKRGKIRTFKINVNNLNAVKVNGLCIEIN